MQVLEVAAVPAAAEGLHGAGSLDADHVGPPVGQLPHARRPRPRDRQVDNAYVTERQVHVIQTPRLAPRAQHLARSGGDLILYLPGWGTRPALLAAERAIRRAPGQDSTIVL